MIAAIGIATVDHIMVLDGFNAADGTFLAETYRVEGGGMAATALCAAAKLGSRTRLFARIGDDINGRFIVEGLNACAVDTSGMVTIPDAPSFTSIIMVDRNTGEKQFYSGRNQPVLEDRAEFDADALAGSKVLLVDGFWMEVAIVGARWAFKRGIPVVGDFKSRYDGLEELLPYVSYLIVPEFFAHELTGSRLLTDMLRGLRTLCPGLPVITRGDRGGVYLQGEKVRQYRVFPVDVVDTTGAGDAFHGAFCHFLAHGFDTARCLDHASAVGAMTCRKVGGRAGLPSATDLKAFMDENCYDPDVCDMR